MTSGIVLQSLIDDRDDKYDFDEEWNIVDICNRVSNTGKKCSCREVNKRNCVGSEMTSKKRLF